MQLALAGVSLHVQKLGTKSAAADVVMLHGLLLGSLASWYFTAAPALARSRHVVLYDLRGHGMSERTRAGYDLASMSGDLAGVVEKCTSGPVDLVGHSFGALVALRFALDHPAQVRRLVMVEAPLPPSSFHELDTFVARPAGEMIDALPEGVRDFVAKGGRRAKRFVESVGFLVSESSLLADLKAEPDVPDAELGRLAMPVLCVYGEQSSCRAVGERLRRAIPGATLRTLEGGHYLHLDASAALTELIAGFLEEASRG